MGLDSTINEIKLPRLINNQSALSDEKHCSNQALDKSASISTYKHFPSSVNVNDRTRNKSTMNLMRRDLNATLDSNIISQLDNTVTDRQIFNQMTGKVTDLPWDFMAYKAPKTISGISQTLKNGLSWARNTKAVNRFTDDLQKKALQVPAPNAYKTFDEQSTKLHQILKKAKVTMTAEVMKKEKKLPGPGYYKTQIKERVKGLSNVVAGKGAFMDEIEYRSRQTPSCAKYKVDYDKIKLRSQIANMNRDKTKRSVKIIQDKSPSPHSFDTMPAIQKFRLKKNPSFALVKAKDIKFIDQHVNMKQKVPGVGKYDTKEKPWNLLSRGLSVPRIKQGL